MIRTAWLWSLVLCACEGAIEGPRGSTAQDGPTDPVLARTTPEVPGLPSVLVCMNAPSGQGYVGMAGERLEADREDAIALANGHRPYRTWININDSSWTLTTDISKALAATPPSQGTDPEAKDPGVGAAFGVTPPSWYEESNVGAFAVFTTFEFAFKLCQRTIEAPSAAAKRDWYEHATFEPTVERATAFCRKTQAAVWTREPRSDEVQACVELAMGLADEPNLTRRWAYVCASVVSSANFLAN